MILLRALAGALLALCGAAHAATYQVGPSRAHKRLVDVIRLVQPGDVVEVDGNATHGAVRWDRSGAPGRPITLRGTGRGAQRPVIDAGGGPDGLRIDASHVVVEDLVVSNASRRCVFLHGHDLTLRRVLVHTCLVHGILGADAGTGDMLLTEVEVHGSGNPQRPSDSHHPIYISTDHAAYPEAVLRIEKSWIHDNFSGNGIKSRARNAKILYNWIEVANRQIHTIEAIGPDPAGAPRGGLCPMPDGTNDALLCNAEIVGNVLVSRGERPFMMRLGSDATGHSLGRYRVVNNTFVAGPAFGNDNAMIRAFGRLDSIELHNNIFWVQRGGEIGVRIVRDAEAEWVRGERRVTGTRNLVTGSASKYASGTFAAQMAGLTQTIFSATAGVFANADLASPEALDLRLAPRSPARDAGNAGLTSTPGFQVRDPTPAPLFHPPLMRPAPGRFEAAPRPPPAGRISLGALEPER